MSNKKLTNEFFAVIPPKPMVFEELLAPANSTNCNKLIHGEIGVIDPAVNIRAAPPNEWLSTIGVVLADD